MKTIIMEVSAMIIFPKDKDGNITIPEEFDMKVTEDGVNYLIKEEKIVKSGTSDTGPH